MPKRCGWVVFHPSFKSKAKHPPVRLKRLCDVPGGVDLHSSKGPAMARARELAAQFHTTVRTTSRSKKWPG